MDLRLEVTQIEREHDEIVDVLKELEKHSNSCLYPIKIILPTWQQNKDFIKQVKHGGNLCLNSPIGHGMLT